MPHGRRASATGLLRSHSPARFFSFFIVKKTSLFGPPSYQIWLFFFLYAHIYMRIQKKKFDMFAFYDKQNDLCKIRCLLFKNPVVRCSKFRCPLA